MTSNPRAPRYLVSCELIFYRVAQGEPGFGKEIAKPYFSISTSEDRVILLDEHPAVYIARSATESPEECHKEQRNPLPMIRRIHYVMEFYGELTPEQEQIYKEIFA